VHDTGRGFAEQSGNGIGLANVRERLASLYGEGARLTLTENSTRGVCATMEVPLDR
jgi:LytS/YehU family sensor histidine kinase